MEKGLIFALFAAIGFAANIVFVRKASAQSGESFTATATSAFIGVPFFAVALFFTGEWSKLLSISWRALIFFAVAGILQYAVGRLLAFNAYRLIGANKASPYTMTSPFYSVILGVLLLKEPITVYLVLGVLCIFAGAALITIERKNVSEERQRRFFGAEIKGILAALGAGVCWGIAPILIKPAIAENGSPLVGAFVSYVTASIVMAFFFFHRQNRKEMVQLPLSAVLILLIIGGIFASVGQLFLYAALGYSPASVVSPILSINVFFIFVFSFFLNRNIEIFSPKVILGMVVTVAGTFLLFQ